MELYIIQIECYGTDTSDTNLKMSRGGGGVFRHNQDGLVGEARVKKL